MKSRHELHVDDTSIIFELDLAETFSITNSYKLTNNPAYIDGFIFGYGELYFRWPDGHEKRLLDGQTVGNMFSFLDWFLECSQKAKEGLRDLEGFCQPGCLSETLLNYYVLADEDRPPLSDAEYETLHGCVIASRNFNTISCYTVAGNCYLEIGVNADGDSDIPKLETWCREVIPETLGLKLLAARNFFVDSYTQYSTSL